MARQYSVIFQGVTVAAAQDFFEITAPATTGLRLLEVRLGKNGTEADQEIYVHIKRGTSGTTSGTSGSMRQADELSTTVTPPLAVPPSVSPSAVRNVTL